jgi:hypothetical protein
LIGWSVGAFRRGMHRGAPLLVILVGLTVLAVPGSASASAGRSVDDRPDLPPATRDAIAALFDGKLARLGLRTTRATLQNLETYRSDPNGRHLAIYVEPTAKSSDARYLTTLVKSARIFLPMVFEEWSGLKSFDICQEPLPGVDDRAEPPPMTQVLVSRKGAGFVHWKRASLEDLVRESTTTRPNAEAQRDFFVYVNPQLAQQPAYRAAVDTVSTTSTSAGNG